MREYLIRIQADVTHNNTRQEVTGTNMEETIARALDGEHPVPDGSIPATKYVRFTTTSLEEVTWR